jgi:hypothetical protein
MSAIEQAVVAGAGSQPIRLPGLFTVMSPLSANVHIRRTTATKT